VRLLQLQLGGVLAGDDALVVVDELREAIEQRGLARAGTAGDDGVHPASTDYFEDFGPLGGDGAEPDQLLERQLVLLEFADGERGSVDRERRHDDVDAGAVGQTRVADRRGFIDPAADLTDDALADIEQLPIVAEADAGLLDLALDFDVGRAGSVHHDIGDVVARQQRLKRPITQHVVADIVEQLLLLGDRHHDVLDRDDFVDDVADFLARGIGVELGELGEVDRLDQGAEDRALDLVIGLRMARVGGRRCKRRRCVDGRWTPAGRWRANERSPEPGRWNGGAAALHRGGRVARRMRRGRRRLHGGWTHRGSRRRRARLDRYVGTLTEHLTDSELNAELNSEPSTHRHAD